MAEALRRVEWVPEDSGDILCSYCANTRRYGHWHSCLLAAALRAWDALEAEEKGRD